jgi:hypothetical protein
MIKIFGGKDIETLEKSYCEPTNRVMDSCDEIVEFTASIKATDIDGNLCWITAYYYQNYPIEVDCLNNLDWEIDDYGICAIRHYWES